MNVLIAVCSIVAAVIVSHMAKSRSKISSSAGYFLVFCITFVCVYYPLSIVWTWWVELKNPDLNAMVDNLGDRGDILDDTELLYKTVNKRAVSSQDNHAQSGSTCKSIAF